MRKLLTTATCAAILTFELSFVPAPAKQEPWRITVRNAHLDLRQNDYARAISIYKEAINQIESSDPRSQARLDLYLNLVNAYIKNMQLSEAEQLLEQIAPQILNVHLDDPLVEVRYWRRLGDLYSAKGETSKCADAHITAVKLLRTYLPYSGFRELIPPLCAVLRSQDWITSCRFINYIRPPDKLDERTKSAVLEAIEGTAIHIRDAIQNYLNAGSYRKVAQLLPLLSDFDPDQCKLLKLWFHFYDLCPRPQRVLQNGGKQKMAALLKSQAKNTCCQCYMLLLQGKISEKEGLYSEAELAYQRACSFAKAEDLADAKGCLQKLAEVRIRSGEKTK